jgi:GxxExxY protein
MSENREFISEEVLQPLNAITEKIIKGAFEVLNTLGPGFMEKVYENALAIELRAMGLFVEQQKPLDVYYKGHVVGHYFADLFVEPEIPVELKTVKAFEDSHLNQLLNELCATNCNLGLLLNFAKPLLEIKRKVNTKLKT